MDYETSATADPVVRVLPVEIEIDLLAKETHTPHALVRELYASELAKVEMTAKIKICNRPGNSSCGRKVSRVKAVFRT